MTKEIYLENTPPTGTGLSGKPLAHLRPTRKEVDAHASLGRPITLREWEWRRGQAHSIATRTRPVRIRSHAGNIHRHHLLTHPVLGVSMGGRVVRGPTRAVRFKRPISQTLLDTGKRDEGKLAHQLIPSPRLEFRKLLLDGIVPAKS